MAKTSWGLLMLLALGGCAANKPVVVDDDVRRIILERVDDAVRAQRELAEATDEGKQQTLRKQGLIDTDEVDIDYVGKPGPLLEALAYRYGYRYVEIGKRLDLKTINLHVKKRLVADVVRDAAYQFGGASGAEVVLDKDAKQIRLIYSKRD